MSESHINDSQPTPQAPASVDAAARQLASARRRRFIKLGGAAVPTALTLASRPVMAWHCNTASTWGSAQGVSTGHSSYTRSRDSTRLFTDETYTLNNWLNNSTRSNLPGSPWTRSPLSRTTSSLTNATHYKNFTVGALLSGTGATIAGCSSADTVWSILNGASKKPNNPLGTFSAGTSVCSDFTKLMLVAWLNYKVLTSTLNKCLAPGPTNVLVKFGNTSYVGPTGTTWNQADVVKYLKKNFVACVDEACN